MFPIVYACLVDAEATAAASTDGASQVSTLGCFCTADRVCPPVAGTTIATYSDTTHITATWSASLGGALWERLSPIVG